MTKIVVLGGGFAGLEAAIKLRKYGYNVTLVSNRDYMFVYPVSIWIPVGKKSFEDVKIPLSKLKEKHGFKLIIDNVEKIESKKNSVILSNSVIEYDYLFIAMGMSKISMPGAENTMSICGKPDEAVKIKNKLEQLIKQGKGNISVGFGGNPKDPTATSVRGGPAFELLFNISHYLNKKGLRDKIDLSFFATMKEPGKRMGDKAFSKLDIFFKHYKVNKLVGKKIKEFTKDAVVFEGNEKLASDLTIFIAGGKGLKLFEESNLPVNEAGFIQINELCRVEGHKNIYAIGDAAELTNHPWAAKQGHIAEVMADVSTYNLNNEIKGKEKRKSYWENLHIVCVMDTGDGAAFISRNKNKNFIIPLPIIGHWLKKAWGYYYINSKLKKIPRVPGM